MAATAITDSELQSSTERAADESCVPVTVNSGLKSSRARCSKDTKSILG